jgi:hypothetical protein
VGILYSIITLLLGFWGFSILFRHRGFRNSLEALHINLSGGEDITKKINEDKYDERTVYIYNNLSRKYSELIELEHVEIITEIQDYYLESHVTKYNDENLYFILTNLNNVNIHKITNDAVLDMFVAMKLYDEHIKTKNIA